VRSRIFSIILLVDGRIQNHTNNYADPDPGAWRPKKLKDPYPEQCNLYLNTIEVPYCTEAASKMLKNRDNCQAAKYHRRMA
jgi:hypothetical protein